MTNSEAIKILESIDNADEMDEELCQAYNMAIEALEKQIPKKPDYEGDAYYDGEIVIDTWICPNCEKDYEVDYDDYDYCPYCGQHIDHSGLTEDD